MNFGVSRPAFARYPRNALDSYGNLYCNDARRNSAQPDGTIEPVYEAPFSRIRTSNVVESFRPGPRLLRLAHRLRYKSRNDRSTVSDNPEGGFGTDCGRYGLHPGRRLPRNGASGVLGSSRGTHHVSALQR